ncbi:MAG: DEAD/DEAH box helicase [Bifidobacteriaceae bacterium]|jgi:hypothetical protein|nr:DEAD/DEAH box helicase [Bifidobacteriaceae bacterium]
MYALHAAWSATVGPALWAEDSTARVKSRSQSVRKARPHPFALPAPALAELLALSTAAAEAGSGQRIDLFLPSLASAPLDSPDIIRPRPRPASAHEPTLIRWSVPVLPINPTRLGDLIADGVPDAMIGQSVRYLAALADFADDLAERGRVAPTLDRLDDAADSPSAWRSRWRPVITGRDLAAFQRLSSAMPPALRAEALGDHPEETASPVDLATAALSRLVDSAARSRLASAGIDSADVLPRRRGRKPAREPAAEAWLTALAQPDGRFTAGESEVTALRRALAQWDAVGAGAASPAELVFRLSDPADVWDDRADLEDVDLEDEDPPRPASPATAATAAQTGPAARTGPAQPAAPDGPAARTGRAATAEPAGATEPGRTWVLSFELRSAADPSLVVPAAQVWDSPAALSRWLERPDEVLLAELARASVIYPELAGALRSARPEALTLDAEGVVDFLTARADLLEQAGFEVLVPAWWLQRRQLGLRVSAGTSGTFEQAEGGAGRGLLTKDALCAFKWELAIGDDPLSEEELEALANAKVPLLFLRGAWVAFDPERVRAALDFVQQEDSGAKTVSDVLALAAAHPDDLSTPLPVTSVEADGVLGALLRGAADAAVQEVEAPASFKAELRPYQRRGLAWLAFLGGLDLGACLADDMGLGKTVQMLALEASERAADPERGPTLLICPVSLVTNWQREAQKFAPDLRLRSHHGSARLHGEDFATAAQAADVVVTSYYTALRDADDLSGVSWARVVLDEAQAIKNAGSRTAKAIRRIEAPHRIALTGTPVENRLAELWSIMDFCNPGILGGPELFRTRYAKPIERAGNQQAAERLRRVTQPYVLRRLKTDKSIIDDLPDKIEIKERCVLTPEQASLYQLVVAEMMERIEGSDGIARRGNVLAAMTKLKQICNHPAQFLHDSTPMGRRSGKVARLEELCDEILAEGDKALLFTQYTEFADMLLGHLTARFGPRIAYLHGGTARARRDELVAAFAQDDGPALFLLSLKAGGVGLNLTAASHVIHIDRWWNPAVEDQATDRAFRIGQTKNVQVRKFICTGTLEDRIDQMIEAKKELANLVVGDGEGWLTELSTSELRSLFELSQEAVGE